MMAYIKQVLIGALLLPSAAIAADKKFNATFNPLPDSVLLSVSGFDFSEVTHFNEKNDNKILFSSSGDIDADGDPEIVISGWSSACKAGNIEPGKTALYALKATATRVSLMDPKATFGTAVTDGTALIKVADFDNDGKDDALIIGHNECPFVPTPNVLYLQKNGGFVANPVLPKMAMHEGSFVDFNGDGHLDLIGAAYEFNNGDAGLDTSTYPAWLEAAKKNATVVLLNNKNGNFTPYVLRFTDAVERDKATNEANPKLKWINPGSASAAADFDGDGELEIVIVDSNDGLTRTPSYGSMHIIIDNLKFEQKHVYGDIVSLPDSYFRQRRELYGALPSNLFPVSISHSIQVDPFDIDNDGDLDILVNTFLWVSDPNDGAGVIQIYRNDGGLKFTDITETALHNYNIGQQASHEMIIRDVNHDGFPDLIKTESAYAVAQKTTWGTANGDAGWQGDLYVSAEGSWTNEILINTGTGKFVSSFWQGFHELTKQKEPIYRQYGVNFEPWGLTDQRFFPYFLKDGRIGFITLGDGYPDVTFIFDARAKTQFHTGPQGSLSAAKGAPGFSEYFYLTEYPDVVLAVSEGKYQTGLAHYIAEGRASGRAAFAAGAHIQGSSADDQIVLREGNEQAYGYAGNDTFQPGLGEDIIDGGDGLDTAVFTGVRSAYRIEITADSLIVTAVSDEPDRNTLKNIEQLQFADASLQVDMKNVAPDVSVANTTTRSGGNVAITVQATDADGDQLKYLWRQTGGPEVSLSGATSQTISFQAPRAAQPSQIELEVTVSDIYYSVSRAVTINVDADQAPQIRELTGLIVDENTTVTLRVSATDAEGDAISFRWVQTGGASVSVSGEQTAILNFVAPTVAADTTLLFTVFASDGILESSKQVSVLVKNATPQSNGTEGSPSSGSSGGSFNNFFLLYLLLLSWIGRSKVGR